MNQINKNVQKYVNKIKSIKCDICNKDITGYKPEALQSGLISDEVITSHALYHISKHYREEVPADLNKFMVIEEEKIDKALSNLENLEKPKQQPKVKNASYVVMFWWIRKRRLALNVSF
jgi:hypothetical protein